ncbi:MAG TPA: DUF1003 domain-containing protein [Solirubrobacteraceae bacterium]|jgi:uncharacterized membrane protein
MNHANANGHDHRLSQGLRWLLLPNKMLPVPINPALLRQREERARNAQNRIADRITAFSGSMLFVYIHILWFGLWIGLGVEKYPFGLLTMIVSLEAIFLSTFVMISQNRADAKRQVIADEQWRMVQEEDHQNKELLDLSRHILQLTKEVRAKADTVQEERDQNKELLALSKQTLALTKDVSSRVPAASPRRPDATN